MLESVFQAVTPSMVQIAWASVFGLAFGVVIGYKTGYETAMERCSKS